MKALTTKLLSILLICVLAFPTGLAVSAEGNITLEKTNVIEAPVIDFHAEAMRAAVRPADYAQHDFDAMRAFLELTDENGATNGSVIFADYDPDRPETWVSESDVIVWDSEGFLNSVSFTHPDLFGTLDLSGCSRLATVTNYSGVSVLNVSGCTALDTLTDMNCPTEQVIVDGCSSLRCVWLGGSNMRLESFEASDLPELLMVGYKQGPREVNLSSIEISNCPNLFYLELDGTDIESIDLNDFPALTTFNAMGKVSSSWSVGEIQPLFDVNVSGHGAIEYLWLDYCSISELDVRGCERLGSIYMTGNNSLESIVFGGNTSLFNIQNYIGPTLERGPMRELDLSRIGTEQSSLSVTLVRSNIESMDFTPVADKITEIMLNDNPLTSIDLTGCANIYNVSLLDTDLAYLDLSGCTELETFEFSNVGAVAFNSELLELIDSEISAENGRLYGIRTYDYIENPETGNWDLVYFPVAITAVGDESRFVGWYDTESDELFSTDLSLELSGGGYALEAVFALSVIGGDINGDGIVNSEDALIAMRFAMGLIELEPEQIEIADMNHDGTVDRQDALLILRTAMSLI